MTTATLTLSRVQKNVQAKIDSVDLPMINWKKVCFIGFFMSLALLVFYVYQINSLMQGSYIVKGYQSQISKLTEENKTLEVSFAEDSFLGGALDKVQALNFQKATSVKYMQISDASVATIRR
jgi:hypothetical protein